jgi:alpha-beta hydrolase superfamily lysophospholipase
MPGPTLRTLDGLDLAGHRRLSASASAAVVVVHGFNASASCPHVVALADAIHADGFDVVTYDARGHGGSPGESTLGDHEQHDVAAAVAEARERTPAVLLVGASMGAIAVLRYAATDRALAGVVAMSCPSAWRIPRSARGGLAALMTRTPPGRRLIRRLTGVRVASSWTAPAPPIDLIGRVVSPVTVMHGGNDKFIARRDADELFAGANSPCQLSIVPEMGHAFGPAAIAPVLRALQWSLEESALTRST